MNDKKETTVKMTVEITVDDKTAMEKFGKASNKVTMGEYKELLSKALENAPFKASINFF